MDRTPKLSPEIALDAVFLALGIAVAGVSWSYGFGNLARPGPGLYPFVIGGAIAGLALVTLTSHVRSSAGGGLPDKSATKTLLFMAATFCLWILAMPLLGYVVVTLIATYAFCKAMRLEGWRKPLAVSGATAAFIYLLFDYWLYIDLPRGIFG